MQYADADAADQPADQRAAHEQWPDRWRNRADFKTRVMSLLLSESERRELEERFGSIIGPIIDAKLEAKAKELEERWRQTWLKTHRQFFGDVSNRDSLLVSREEAAEMLETSLSTIKRMEKSGELPEPIKFGERIVRHRLVDIEAIARTRVAVWPD